MRSYRLVTAARTRSDSEKAPGENEKRHSDMSCVVLGVACLRHQSHTRRSCTESDDTHVDRYISDIITFGIKPVADL
jgi:hypothetical protein